MTFPTDAELVERAVRNAAPRRGRRTLRWAVMKEVFGMGSGYSAELCRRFGLDPDEYVTKPAGWSKPKP